MNSENKSIIVCGNGISRKQYNFSDIKSKLNCPLWACNLAYLELPADLIFSVDDDITKFLKNLNVNLATYDPDLKLESASYDKTRQKNSAGMIAVEHAIKLQYNDIHMYGFDSLSSFDDDERVSNCYSGAFYEKNRQCTIVDTYRRQLYFNWIRKTNPNVKFYLNGQRI